MVLYSLRQSLGLFLNINLWSRKPNYNLSKTLRLCLKLCEPSWSGNLLRKSGFACRVYLCGSLKAQAKLLSKRNYIAFFGIKNISYVIKIYFFKFCRIKSLFAVLLKRKSCICCRKHCIAYFRRHMECAVLKRFLKVQGTFSIKKFLQIPLFHLEKNKFNPLY